MSSNERSDTKALVQTYNHPSYDDPYDIIQDYERVQREMAAHPNKGSSALASITGLPRGRIRSWVDGNGMPDCYRGLQTALDNGWIFEGWNNKTVQALNCLAAWIFSSGSINDNWVPLFIADESEEIEALRSYASLAGIQIERTRETDERRATEWRPRRDASVLGRVLYTWIEVRGNKRRDVIDFPEYLLNAPTDITLSFLRVYVQQRGSLQDIHTPIVQISVDRDSTFWRALKACLQRVVDNQDEIRGSGRPLRIYGDAMETLRQYPEINV